MKQYFLHGSNLPEYVDRVFLVKTFQQFGDITKIYISPDASWFKIYFKGKECADNATCLNGISPYFMQLKVGSENINKDRQKKQNRSSASLTSSGSDTMLGEDSDCYASAGPTYYNIHGVSVPTLTDDDGTIYVPLHEVREVGFELFDDSNIPRNINFNKQALNEFKIYLNIQARKYIEKMQWSKPPDRAIEEIKNEIVNSYTNSGQMGHATLRQYNTQSSTSSPISPTITIKSEQNKMSANEGFNKKKNSRTVGQITKNIQPELQTNIQPQPLQPQRRPVRINDNIPQNTQTGNDDHKYWQQDNDSSVSNNDISGNLNKENVYPRKHDIYNKEVTPVENKLANFKQVELTLNKIVKVTVSFVESQRKCWAYKKEDEDKIRTLLYDVNMEVRTNPTVQPSVGKIYAALYEGAWYRAMVLEDVPALKVQYLDFGNFNEEKLTEIRDLSPKITSEPMLAISLNFTTPPQTNLELDKELTIIPLKKNNDGSYDVEEVSENNRTPESIKLNVIPAGKIFNPTDNLKSEKSAGDREKTVNGVKSKAVNNQTKMEFKSKSPQLLLTDKNDRQTSPNPTLRERLQHMSPHKEVKILNPDRKSVVDLIDNDSGIVQFVEKITDDTCICFICPTNFTDVVSSLDEITESQNIIGKVGDFVSIFTKEINDGAWVRATILNIQNGVYTLALVDYGKIISATKVCKLEKRFVDIPEFVCVLSGNIKCMKLLEQRTSGDFTSSENNKIKMSFDDDFYDIIGSRWNPFENFKSTKKSNQNILTVAPDIKRLRERERVLPIILDGGKLLVRNKESNAVLAKIEIEISKHNATPLAQEPVIDQIVLCPHNAQTVLRRGIIKSINSHYADVEFIDYGFTDTIPIKKLMTITESLAREDNSLIPIVLKGFENGVFPDSVIEFIEDCSRQARKFVAIKCSDNVYDLILEILPTGEVTFSSKFAKTSDNNNNRQMYQNTASLEIKMGEIQVVCVAIEEQSGLIKLIPEEDVSQKMLEVNTEIAECLETNTEPYSPIIDELCLAKYDGEWYRATILNVNEALEEFNVYYIDFGNTSTVPSIDIRRISEKCSKFPALAFTGCLQEIENNCAEVTQKVLDVIRKEITVGDNYVVEVLKKLEKSKYLIKIPSLSPKLS